MGNYTKEEKGKKKEKKRKYIIKMARRLKIQNLPFTGSNFSDLNFLS